MVVACQTSFGVLFLLAPLAAALLYPGTGISNQRLSRILATPEREKHWRAFASFAWHRRRFGRFTRADVREAPRLDLLSAMGLAVEREHERSVEDLETHIVRSWGVTIAMGVWERSRAMESTY